MKINFEIITFLLIITSTSISATSKPKLIDFNSIRNNIYPKFIFRSLEDNSLNDTSVTIQKKEDIILEPFIADIFITYAIDQPLYYQYITNNDLEKWKIDIKELRPIAIENLRRLSENIQFIGDSTYGAIYIDGNNEAVLVLIDQVWDRLFSNFKINDIIVAIPSRDVLLFSSYGNEKGLIKLKEGVLKISAQGDHLISRWIIRRKDNTWVNFLYVQ
jgi:uncharacterized protein YtpQ (UPF0354 family)